MRRLLFEEGSFLVYYPDPQRAQVLGHWCFVPNITASKSEIVKDSICNDLALREILVPELDNKEYKMQCAVGTQKGRIFKISDTFKNIFNDEKKYDLS